MPNTIKTLNWTQDTKGNLIAPAGTGVLKIRFYGPVQGSEPSESYWTLNYYASDEGLGKFESLPEALQAANDWVGDS